MILHICSNMKQISSSSEGKLLRYLATRCSRAKCVIWLVFLYFRVVKPEH